MQLSITNLPWQLFFLTFLIVFNPSSPQAPECILAGRPGNGQTGVLQYDTRGPRDTSFGRLQAPGEPVPATGKVHVFRFRLSSLIRVPCTRPRSAGKCPVLYVVSGGAVAGCFYHHVLQQRLVLCIFQLCIFTSSPAIPTH